MRRFDHGSRPRKPAVRDDDVHALVVPEEAAGRQVVHLGEIRAAVPADGELCELVNRPVVLLVRPPELLDVKPGFDGVRRDVEALVEIFRPEHRVFGRDGRVVDHVLRPDGVAPAGACGLEDCRVVKIHVAVFHRWRGAEKAEDRVGVVAGHGAAEDLPAEL